MISLAELSKKDPVFNNDLYIRVDNLIELIFSHSINNKDEVITYLVQGLTDSSILVHQYTKTVGYHDINQDFFDFLTDDELEAYKFCELVEKFIITDYYLPRSDLAEIKYIKALDIKSLSDFNCNGLPNHVAEQNNDELDISKAHLSYVKTIQELKEENNKLKKQLAQNNTEVSLKYDWQSMKSYIYPPELHIAIIMWEKMYASDELISQHLTRHSDRFRNVAKKMGLTKESVSVALIDRLKKITTPQDKKQSADFKKLKSILDFRNDDS